MVVTGILRQPPEFSRLPMDLRKAYGISPFGAAMTGSVLLQFVENPQRDDETDSS
jgi:hypothetical protein